MLGQVGTAGLDAHGSVEALAPTCRSCLGSGPAGRPLVHVRGELLARELDAGPRAGWREDNGDVIHRAPTRALDPRWLSCGRRGT